MIIGQSAIIGEPEAPPLISFTMYTTASNTESGACNLSGNSATYYHDGAFALPDVTHTIYTDEAGTSTLNGGNKWWKPITGEPIKINTSGEMILQGLCL